MKTIAIAPYVVGSIVTNLEHHFGKTGAVVLTQKNEFIATLKSKVVDGIKAFSKTLDVNIGSKKAEVNKLIKDNAIGDGAPADWSAATHIAAAAFLEYNIVFTNKPVGLVSGRHLTVFNTAPEGAKVYGDNKVASIPLKTKGDTLWMFPPSASTDEAELLIKVTKFIAGAKGGKALKAYNIPQFYLDNVPCKLIQKLVGAWVGNEENAKQKQIGAIGAPSFVGTARVEPTENEVDLPAKGLFTLDGDFTMALVKEGHRVPFFVANVSAKQFLKNGA